MDHVGFGDRSRSLHLVFPYDLLGPAEFDHSCKTVCFARLKGQCATTIHLLLKVDMALIFYERAIALNRERHQKLKIQL